MSQSINQSGLFVKHLNDANFHLLVDCVVSHIKQGTDEASLYSYIQTIGMIRFVINFICLFSLG